MPDAQIDPQSDPQSDPHPSPLLESRFVQIKERLTGRFTALHALAVETGPEAARSVAADAIASVHAPFLFVVVGEVKAGKSSLVNALLGADICAVAPEPCTDVIQKIVYGPAPATRMVSSHLREISLPVEILKDIAIVDTPGTNTLVAQHQEITEAFIPQSDLALFVFPATNPHTRSAWEFFDFVHEAWRKKAVFVLQQKDRASEEELTVNTAKVVEYARGRSLAEPAVFAVSARKAQEDPEGSGMAALLGFIRAHVTGGRRAREKMESCITTGLTVLDLVDGSLTAQSETLRHDRREEATITDYLTLARKSCQSDVEWIRARTAEAYARHADALARDFEDGLSLVQMLRMTAYSVVGKKEKMQQWLDGIFATFKQKLDADVETVSAQGASRLRESVGKVMETLAGQLREEAAARSREAAVTTMTRTRLESLDQARQQVLALLDDAALDERLTPRTLQYMGEQAVAGGIITAMGAIIAAATHAAVIDVTGGLISLAGAVLALNILVIRRRASIKKFRAALEQGRERLQQEVEEQLTRQLTAIFDDIHLAFTPFFNNLARREDTLGRLDARSRELRQALLAERDELPRFE
ncbi:dynamin family protein [Megalodesulfovibrio gigas]|uniref:Putative GTP-binding protein HSR1-related protein n=1 Tax=Megalodesulfovibrio gigas (strain ATCC 19364 / DSM 1382 / NCIMB 9332 / VKM B-1759) TaxID=1121448 RepID=T2GG25_MEGG1|nr:dynamin family protein [Megalodesulfovibrio gigas]AGW15169.1 putative GTP-binding protein HSR1-related protein [Megalodesulfovibrio gigas DSM 1382 = ATCC 19364]